MFESLPDISFRDAELFASAKARSNLRAVTDIFAWQAGDVRARSADVFAFNDCDALPALKAGYRAACLAACTELKLPANYHWPTDVTENLCWETIAQAATVCEALIRRLAITPV